MAQHIVSTTETWRRSAALARAPQAGAYVAVRYEDLVADPRGVVQKVCGVAGLDYRAEMLEMGGQPLWGGNNSSDQALRGQPGIFDAAVARHLRQLAAADVAFIQWRAGREMQRWGYPRRPVPLSAGDRGRLALRVAQEGAWRLARRLRLRHLIARVLGRFPPDF
jgi:hypothetical protein